MCMLVSTWVVASANSGYYLLVYTQSLIYSAPLVKQLSAGNMYVASFCRLALSVLCLVMSVFYVSSVSLSDCLSVLPVQFLHGLPSLVSVYLSVSI
jgi:hypothetical protein